LNNLSIEKLPPRSQKGRHLLFVDGGRYNDQQYSCYLYQIGCKNQIGCFFADLVGALALCFCSLKALLTKEMSRFLGFSVLFEVSKSVIATIDPFPISLHFFILRAFTEYCCELSILRAFTE